MWYLIVFSWLLCATAVIQGGVPPAPLHVGGYQRRLAFAEQGSQSSGSGGAAALEELFRDAAEPEWEKRDGQGSQHMLRSPRGSRQYDVPQIGECLDIFLALCQFFGFWISAN